MYSAVTSAPVAAALFACAVGLFCLAVGYAAGVILTLRRTNPRRQTAPVR